MPGTTPDAAPEASINVTKEPMLVPDIAAGPGLANGSIYLEFAGQQLARGQRLVLESPDNAPMELRSVSIQQGSPAPGPAYLADSDLATFRAGLNPGDPVTIRAFRIRDRLRKLLSANGFLVLAPAVAAVLAAVATLLSALVPAPQPSAAARVDALLAWSAQPLADLGPSPDTAALVATQSELRRRIASAQWCVRKMQGHEQFEIPAPTPVISCANESASWWHTNWPAVTGGGLALLTAIAAAGAALRRSGFQQTL